MLRTEEIANTFNRYGGWNFRNYDILCKKLKKANAKIIVHATSIVLLNNSIGWAALSVGDIDSGISTLDATSYDTNIYSIGNKEKSEEMMVGAINNAANNWLAIDDALAALEVERKKARAIFRKQK